MNILTTEQIEESIQLIDNFHVLFIADNIGIDILSKQDKIRLLENGVDIEAYQGVSKIEHAYKFGMLSQALDNKATKNMSYAEFKKFLKSGKFLPLTKAETEALNSIKYQSYNDIKGLGNRISTDFRRIAIESDMKLRAEYENIIRNEAADAVLKRKTVKELSSELGHKTKDWSRDFDRIADYIMHTALDNGKANAIIRQYGEDALVYKQVYAGACNSCIEAYLTGGIGSKPKVFKIKDLINNGNNIGRKTKDWLPVIGSLHPFCRCELFEVPTSTEWDEDTNSFSKLVRNTFNVKRLSKPIITIRNE